MMGLDQSTAVALDEVVRDVPGVSALYRSGGLLGRVVASGKEVVLTEGELGPYVAVTGTDEGPKIEVTIGVDAESAVRTCRAVRDAVAEWLRSRGRAAAAIMVTVAQVAA